MILEDNLLTSTKKSAKIMVVDDNLSNILLIKRILEVNGYKNIKGISNPAEVLDEYKKWQPDIILLDLLMPDINGLDILDQINNIRSKQYLPVIMLTADNNMDNRLKALSLGVNDYLSKPFNAVELLARVENLIRIKASMDQAMATEVAFLQAQIKPHFLFNTLNTISYLCDTDPKEASALIDDFSEYLRQSFDLKNLETHIPIDKELKLVNAYVKIQKARFQERIGFDMNAECAKNISVPPLCIQPLVENAFKHGLKKSMNVSVKVLFNQVDEGTLISIKDNGCGIEKDKLETILIRSEGKGIGLWNIDARLQKYYGQGLKVKSEAGQGTEISFVIPFEDE